MGDIPDTVLYALGANKVVAYPTSTLPGLATLPTKEGLDALFALKKRHSSQPVSLGVISLEQASSLVEVPHPFALMSCNYSWSIKRSFKIQCGIISNSIAIPYVFEWLSIRVSTQLG